MTVTDQIKLQLSISTRLKSNYGLLKHKDYYSAIKNIDSIIEDFVKIKQELKKEQQKEREKNQTKLGFF